MQLKVTKLEWHPQNVMRAVRKAERSVLRTFGMNVRQRARKLIKPGGKKGLVSRAGEPPRSHAKGANIRTILYEFDASDRTVYVGPIKFTQKPSLTIAGGLLTSALEKSGFVSIREKRVGKHWRTWGKKRPKPGQPDRVRRVMVKARPFMVPALEIEARTFPDLWANKVKK